MLHAVRALLRDRLRAQGELIPVGITWSSMVITDGLVIFGGLLATLQRPASDLPAALVAFAILLVPPLLFLVFTIKLGPAVLWITWSAATATRPTPSARREVRKPVIGRSATPFRSPRATCSAPSRR